jgi:predicted RNA-binding protein
MEAWLCPVKRRSWQLIKQERVFGAPAHTAKLMNQVRIGDILVIHSLGQVKGIIALCKVTSNVHLENSDIWGVNRYPLRVHIEILSEFPKPIPLSCIYGGNQ